MAKDLGLKVIYEPDIPSDAVVDIVFVHGLRGNSYKTWFTQETSSYWPLDFLSHDIPLSRISTFGYAANWTNSKKETPDDYASDLLQHLRILRSLPKDVSTTLQVVCHLIFSSFVRQSGFLFSSVTSRHLKSYDNNAVDVISLMMATIFNKA
jgi:hypothetical protein